MIIGVVGAGLIGGSIARRSRELGHQVIVCDSRKDIEQLLQTEGIQHADISTLLRDSDFMFICVPLFAIEDIAVEISKHRKVLGARVQRLVITDVGSVKIGISNHFQFLTALPQVEFCAGHPMAGSEKQGFEHSVSSMFVSATWVLCPESSSPRGVVSLIELISGFGAKVACISEQDHDRAVASISHIPYVLSAVALLTLPVGKARNLALRVAASSFRDLTRVAGSPVELSAAMTELNHESVVKQLKLIIEQLKNFEEALSSPRVDSGFVQDAYSEAKLLRQRYFELRGDRSQIQIVIPIENLIAEAISICSDGRLIHSAVIEGQVVRLLCDSTTT